MTVEVTNPAEEQLESVIRIIKRRLAEIRRDKITGRLTIDLDLREGGVSRKFTSTLNIHEK